MLWRETALESKPSEALLRSDTAAKALLWRQLLPKVFIP